MSGNYNSSTSNMGWGCDPSKSKLKRRYSIFPQNHRRSQSKPQQLTLVPAPAKPFKCPHCLRSFSTSSRLKVHFRGHTGQRLSECRESNKKFKTKGHLKKHLIHHTRISDHLCRICSYAAQSRSTLEIHMTSHSGVKPFQCPSCPKRFGHKVYLRLHNLRVHNDDGRRHQCGICDYSTKNKSYLKRHSANHRNERKFKCQFCDRRFKTFSNLVQHMGIHTKEKPFQCRVCHKNFSYSRACKLHVAADHDGTSFKCDLCGMEFRSKVNLKCHVALHATHAPNCEFCLGRGRLPRVCDLNFHRRIHIGRNLWKCRPCHAYFVNKVRLGIHQRAVKCQEKRKAEVLIRQSRIILQRI